MCGENSVEVVKVEKKVAPTKAAVTKAKAQGLPVPQPAFVVGAKIAFLVNEDGSIGLHHSDIRRAAKITDKAKYVNANLVDGGIKYENGEPTWYTGKVKEQAEKQLESLRKKIAVSGKAYASRMVVVHRVLDRDLAAAAKLKTAKERNAAIGAANKKFAASKKAAFATLAKLGGIAA